MNPITFCISTYNNIEYLKLAIKSVRFHSFYKNAPFVIHAENCTDGTNEWLTENKEKYNLEIYTEPNNEIPKGIGGGMNFCADKVNTEYIMFLHSDFYVSKNWDINCLNIFDKYPKEKMMVFSQRFQPNIFNENSRYGTIIVPLDEFGAYYNDFNEDYFIEYAEKFCNLNDFEIPKSEGVSGLIKKVDWDFIGGNDPLFAPSSYEDMDLFLRMKLKGFKFVLTSKSVVWHFGARGSHRLEENNGKTSKRQQECERKNYINWVKKWGIPPKHDEYGNIIL
jgi:GT2 family glycosyltransferase